jgi:hypothetical protein
MRTRLPAALAFLLVSQPALAAELIFPQNRNGYYSSEAVEIAVAGLAPAAKVSLEFAPQKPGPAPVPVRLEATSSTALVILPPGTLAPGVYTVRLDGKDAGTMTIASGVNVSTMLLSQTTANPRAGKGDFLLGNAFGFGLLDPQGQPLRELRGRRSGGMEVFENAIKADLPTVVYMYWTGYVTHKPFGSEKSWAATSEIEAMRLLSFHTAQRLRRYARNIPSVGTLDEPGLSWGKTPAGGMASGFPNWDEKSWYEACGWKYTNDPGARPDDDWMKYLTIRTAIMREGQDQARRDLRTVWPGLVFSTDLYAPHAIMDGTDPLNQQVNDFPSSHVFLDWGTGRLGALSGVYLEKAHDPASKLAHAMNGQLMGEPVPQPAQRNTYHLMRNALFAAGLHSNWWLNPTGMKDEDLAAVNEPGLRLGPLFQQMAPRDHDVAVLWSYTELAMREKEITAREAKKMTGEQIKLMIASLPETTGAKGSEVEVNAYNVGQNYKDQVLTAHQALVRAGYPAHIVHERLLPGGVLKRYRTLVIVGQTFALPGEVRGAIEEFWGRGGKVVADRTCKVPFPGAIVTDADFRDLGFRWADLFGRAEKKDHGFKNDREASYYLTNHFMDKPARAAVAPVKESLRQTASRPVLVSDSVWLAAERHTAGEGALYLVLSAYEKLPELPPERKYFLYNYAPYEVTYQLRDIKPGSVVYCIEGQGWSRAREVKDFAAPQKETFAPGEMKLFLIAPRRPNGIQGGAVARGNDLAVTASLGGVKMPWPLTVTVKGADGKEWYRVYRATDAAGKYTEAFPIGSNAPAGTYRVEIEDPTGTLHPAFTVDLRPAPTRPVVEADAVRVFDAEAIRRFFAGKPSVVIAVGNEAQKEIAQKLAAELGAAGVSVTVKPESEVLHKVRYPRVWNPFAKLYRARGDEKNPPKEVKTRTELGTHTDGRLVARTADGKDIRDDWRQPHSLVTIVADGFVDFGGDQELCFEPGVKLYFDDKRQMSVIRAEVEEVRTSNEFRARWSRPWDRLTTHVGAYQLPPALPEAYSTDSHLILLGDSQSGTGVAALQASEILPQVVDARYPGPGRALVMFAWSPFGVEKNVVFVGASDAAGLRAGALQLSALARSP